jgi:hypothetical protein
MSGPGGTRAEDTAPVTVDGVHWEPRSGAAGDRLEGTLPDGRTGIVSQRENGEWGWGIRGTGALDDDSGRDTYATQEDAMRAILHPDDAAPDRGLGYGRTPRTGLTYGRGGTGAAPKVNEFHGPMAVEYEQGGRCLIAGGLSAEYINGYLSEWMRENAGCTIIRVFNAVAEAQQKFPPGTRVIREDHQPAMRWRGTVTGGHAAADEGGCTVAVKWDWHGTSSAIPVTVLHAQEGQPDPGEGAKPDVIKGAVAQPDPRQSGTTSGEAAERDRALNRSEAAAALVASGMTDRDAAACVWDAVDMGRGVGFTELADGKAVGVACGPRGSGELVLLTGYTRQALSAMQSEAFTWLYGDGRGARAKWDRRKAWAAKLSPELRWSHASDYWHENDLLGHAAVCEAALEAGDAWITASTTPVDSTREAVFSEMGRETMTFEAQSAATAVERADARRRLAWALRGYLADGTMPGDDIEIRAGGGVVIASAPDPLGQPGLVVAAEASLGFVPCPEWAWKALLRSVRQMNRRWSGEWSCVPGGTLTEALNDAVGLPAGMADAVSVVQAGDVHLALLASGWDPAGRQRYRWTLPLGTAYPGQDVPVDAAPAPRDDALAAWERDLLGRRPVTAQGAPERAAVTDSTNFPHSVTASTVTGGQPNRVRPGTAAAKPQTPGRGQ